METKAAINEFLEDRASLGRRPKSVRFYKTHLRGFRRFLEAQQITNVEQIDRRIIRGFFAELNTRGTKQITRSAYDRSLRVFFRFCKAERWIEQDPMADRPRIKPLSDKPDCWEWEEIEALLTTCDESTIGLRDRALMLCLLDTGMRAGELTDLPIGRLTMPAGQPTGSIYIAASASKSKQSRTVFFGEATREALEDWLAVRPVSAATVFVSSDGSGLTDQAITPSGLNQMIRRRCETANITPRRKLCHVWRHTFARQYILAGGDLETLRRMLGHQSLSTVAIYLNFASDDLAAKHAQLSPVRQMIEARRRAAINS